MIEPLGRQFRLIGFTAGKLGLTTRNFAVCGAPQLRLQCRTYRNRQRLRPLRDHGESRAGFICKKLVKYGARLNNINKY